MAAHWYNVKNFDETRRAFMELNKRSASGGAAQAAIDAAQDALIAEQETDITDLETAVAEQETDITDLETAVTALQLVNSTYGWINGSMTTQTLAATATKLTLFDSGASSGVTEDHANNKLTIVTAGLYRIHLDVSIKAASGTSEVLFTPRINGAAIGFGIQFEVGTIAEAGSSSVVRSLAANDVIEMYSFGAQAVVYTATRIHLMVERKA